MINVETSKYILIIKKNDFEFIEKFPSVTPLNSAYINPLFLEI